MQTGLSTSGLHAIRSFKGRIAEGRALEGFAVLGGSGGNIPRGWEGLRLGRVIQPFI